MRVVALVALSMALCVKIFLLLFSAIVQFFLVLFCFLMLFFKKEV